MMRFSGDRRGLLVLVAVAAVAVAACGGSTQSAGPGASGAGKTAQASQNAGSGGNGGNGGGSSFSGGLGGLAANFANVSSYKFTMTLSGVPGTETLLALGGPSGTSSTSITMSGMVIAKPSPAFDITMGTFHEIDVNGTDYVDLGTGAFMSSPGSGNLISFSPSTMFTSMVDAIAGDFSKVGTGQKNNVDADHYQASPAAYAGLDSIAGVTGAKWTADVWIARSGGYPVSMAIVGTSGGQVVFEVQFDIANVNDSANAVTAPTNP